MPGFDLPSSRWIGALEVVALAGALGVASPARPEAANAFDREVMEFVQAHRSHDLDHLMSTASDQWNKENFVMAALAVTARGDDRAFAALEECAKSIAISEMVVTPLKYATNRRRPDGESSRSNSSFPSSHAATAFAAATALGDCYPGLRVPAYAGAALIAYSRVYAERHHATDVIAGAAIGILAARFSRAHLSALEIDRRALAARLPVRLDLRSDGRGLVRLYIALRI